MSTRLVMIVSAVFMGLTGVAASFLPHEVLQYAGEEVNGSLPVVVQLLGALYIGFAMMNWMAKDSLIGGIYNRPLAIGNFVHFLAGALALVKVAVRQPFSTPLVVLTVVYAVLAAGFAYVFFTSPVKRTDH
jgi:hypothetical protein